MVAPAVAISNQQVVVRHDWSKREAKAIYNLPFNDLLFKAQSIHRQNFNPNEIQMSQLISIKTGGCPEDCGYCSQSTHHNSGLKATKIIDVKQVIIAAKKAKSAGATRYCMGAAWREPKERHMDDLCAMIKGVKNLGMESCMTLGMLSDNHMGRLKNAGLDYYNHNIDTSKRYYEKIITTRQFSDRLDTLTRVRNAGIKVCSGGIIGMGEQIMDRVEMLLTLATLEQHPESVPVNMLIPIKGTPLAEVKKIEPIDFIRTIALARILMPKSHLRLSAGRIKMSDEMQALCFFAGANSIFIGDRLLTANNPEEDKDSKLFDKLGISPTILSNCKQEIKKQVNHG